MDDRENEEIENVLQFGAKQLFEQGDEEQAGDIKYSDSDVSFLYRARLLNGRVSPRIVLQIDKLLEESQQAVEEADKAKDANTDNKAFSYAKVWEKDGGLNEQTETEDTADAEEQRGFWASVCKLAGILAELLPSRLTHSCFNSEKAGAC